jgi:N-carbamoylputrescine amidase
VIAVACVQMEPRVGRKAENVERSCELAARAAVDGADLVVLPELCNSGYVFETREEALALAEPVPDGETVAAWLGVCRAHGVTLVAGLAEREGSQLFNSAVVLSPAGYVGTYRKLHLWNRENLWFQPGDRGVPVFDTPHGRIAALVCYDGWFGECFRLASAGGAGLVCIPTNWVPIPGQRAGEQAMATILCMANAHANSVYVAAADRVGVERGQPFIGQSVIIDYTGWPLAGPAAADGEEIVLAEVDLGRAAQARRWNRFNDPLRDRRADVYGDLPTG